MTEQSHSTIVIRVTPQTQAQIQAQFAGAVIHGPHFDMDGSATMGLQVPADQDREQFAQSLQASGLAPLPA